MDEKPKEQSEIVEIDYTEEYIRSLGEKCLGDNYYDNLISLDESAFNKEFSDIVSSQKSKFTRENELKLLMIQQIRQSRMVLPNKDVKILMGQTMGEQNQLPKPIQTWGAVIKAIDIENSKKILVTGPPMSGKATVRNLLAKQIRKDSPQKTVFSLDFDYVNPGNLHFEGDINVIEDLHALNHGKPDREDLLKTYDLVVYLAPYKEAWEDMKKSREEAWKMFGMKELTTMSDDELERTPEKLNWYNSLSYFQALKQAQIPTIIIDSSNLIKAAYQLDS